MGRREEEQLRRLTVIPADWSGKPLATSDLNGNSTDGTMETEVAVAAPVEGSGATARRIQRALRAADLELDRRFPLLKHQDALGLGLLLGAVGGMAGSAWAYAVGLLPGWACFFGNAFLASIIHELEHDLIHNLYFKGRERVQNLMFALMWMFKGNTISPWYRRKLHLLHHRESGQTIDIEERLIGNGMPWGWRRLAIMLDTTAVLFLRIRELAKEIPQFRLPEFFRAIVPVAVSYAAVWTSFLGISAARLLGIELPLPDWVVPAVNFLMVTLVGPNILRQASIAIVSSNCHYFGDIERFNLAQQGQVLRHWLFFPLQLFCFNFGSTHIIHHFYVGQPFFRRQLFAAQAHAILREGGVRFDDLSSIVRDNRYHEPAAG